jgi:hypothetical protein
MGEPILSPQYSSLNIILLRHLNLNSPHAILLHGGWVEFDTESRSIGQLDEPMTIRADGLLEQLLSQGIGVLIEL